MSDEEVLVVETPLEDMLEASGVSFDLRPNPLLDEPLLASFVRIGLLRSSRWKASSRAPKLPGLREAAELLRHLADYDREHVVVVAVDAQQRLMGICEVHIGAATQSLLDVRDLIRVPLLLGAAGFYMAHNHPSGNPEPSREDRQTTAELSRVAVCQGIALIGSLVIARDGFGDVQRVRTYAWSSP